MKTSRGNVASFKASSIAASKPPTREATQPWLQSSPADAKMPKTAGAFSPWRLRARARTTTAQLPSGMGGMSGPPALPKHDDLNEDDASTLRDPDNVVSELLPPSIFERLYAGRHQRSMCRRHHQTGFVTCYVMF